jgi:hypothetical protein
MIGFHYHVAQADTPRLGIRKGDRLCHVFSDLTDLVAAGRELRAWADRVGPHELRLQDRGTRRQHFDLWGPWLAVCGPPADRLALKRWLRPSDR